MTDILNKALKILKKNSDDEFFYKNYAETFRPFKKMTKRDLIDLESKLGATIFGEMPEGGRREFFNLDEKTWIWYEEWVDGAGNTRELTTRYEIQENQIVKVQPGPRYEVLTGRELQNFKIAVMAYYELILRRVYRRK